MHRIGIGRKLVTMSGNASIRISNPTLTMTNRTLLVAAGLTTAALAAPASAQFQEGDYEIRLDGFAQTDVNVNGTDIRVGGTLGYFFSDQLEGGVRQTLGFNDLGGSNTNGSTALFGNYHFGDPGGELQPFIGASLGYNYGDAVTDTFFAGPEGGVKYFIEDNWFIFGQVEYQFFFEDGDEADEAFDDGSFLFRLGVGVVL